MSKFLKAFKYASIISISINTIIYLTGYLYFDFKLKEVDSYPESFLLFFVPVLIVNYWHYLKPEQTNDAFKIVMSIIKLSLLTFFISYVLFFFINFRFDFKVPLSLRGGMMTSLIAFLYALYISVLIKNTFIERKEINVKLINKYIILIWFVVTIVFIALYMFFFKISLAELRQKEFLIMLVKLACIGLLSVIIITKTILALDLYKSKFLKLVWLYIIYSILFSIIVTFFSFGHKLLGNDINLMSFIIKGVTAFCFYFMFLTAFVHIYYFLELNKQQKENLKQVGISASLKYQQLKAQLSPHFLFNNISVLTGLIEENPRSAIKFSENLSNIYRFVLNHEKEDLVLLKEEMIFANQYLSLLKVRFEDSLNYGDLVTPERDYYLLTMALQQVLENVVKHNEICREKPIEIEFEIENEYLVVANNLNPKFHLKRRRKREFRI